MKNSVFITATVFAVVTSSAYGQTMIYCDSEMVSTYVVPASVSTHQVPGTLPIINTTTTIYAPGTTQFFPAYNMVPLVNPTSARIAYCGFYAQRHHRSQPVSYHSGQTAEIQTISMPPPMVGAPGTGDCCFSAPAVTFPLLVVRGQIADKYIGQGIVGHRSCMRQTNRFAIF